MTFARSFVLAAGALCLLGASPAHAGDAEEEKLARELMELTGAAALGRQVMEGMLQQFAGTGMPQEVIDEIMAVAKPEELTEMVVPIYIKHYDEKTLQAAVDFYKTPEGSALVAKVPEVTQESMVVGQQWGQEVVVRVQAILEKRAAP